MELEFDDWLHTSCRSQHAIRQVITKNWLPDSDDAVREQFASQANNVVVVRSPHSDRECLIIEWSPPPT